MWKQLITPNFDPYIIQGRVTLNSWLGWCMAYVEQSVGLFYLYPTALVGWSKVKGRHNDKNVPKGVWVPLWYSGYKGQGHVLWAKLNSDGSGVAYTSPRTHKPFADKISFSSLNNLTARLKTGWAWDIVFLGWSEYVGSKQIIKYVATSAKRVSKKGTATVTVKQGLNVRATPSIDGKKVATYAKGEKFGYDSYIITGGYVWLSYVGRSGNRVYVAEGPNDGNRKNVYVKGGIS